MAVFWHADTPALTRHHAVSYPPDSLVRLLSARDAQDAERAWESFVREHSRLIHMAARKSTRDYDQVMDRYTFVLERLREDDFRRLRSYSPDGRSKFTTWLVVVASRLCVDHHRSVYGRHASDDSDPAAQRRRLVDLVGEDIPFDTIPDSNGTDPQKRLRKLELREALAESIDALDAEDRLFIRLRYQDGRSAAEVAQSLGLASEFAAYRRQRSLLKRLKDELVRRGVDGPRP